jgi:hypothetical protein
MKIFLYSFYNVQNVLLLHKCCAMNGFKEKNAFKLNEYREEAI